ncbi:peptidylprolyl isomerase [Pseudanabaenaceae cyanobacterium LEGE 13415]|nr:peptidylprolyl isomerase [Pseudanabaenaceae cyanobacterium LEGE 13415]
MSDLFPVFPNDVVQQVKLSLKLPEVIDAIVTRQLVNTVSTRSGIQVNSTELQQAADAFRLKHNLSSAEATLAWLERYRLTIDDFEALIYAETLQAKLSHHLFDRQVESHFRENAAHYTQAILYKVTLPNLRIAEEMYQAIAANETVFHEVVQQFASDENRRRNGYWGTFMRSRLPQDLASRIFSTDPPTVLSPISPVLIFVEAFIQPELTESLQTQIVQDLFSQWTQENIDRAEIRLEL